MNTHISLVIHPIWPVLRQKQFSSLYTIITYFKNCNNNFFSSIFHHLTWIDGTSDRAYKCPCKLPLLDHYKSLLKHSQNAKFWCWLLKHFEDYFKEICMHSNELKISKSIVCGIRYFYGKVWIKMYPSK